MIEKPKTVYIQNSSELFARNSEATKYIKYTVKHAITLDVNIAFVTDCIFSGLSLAWATSRVPYSGNPRHANNVKYATIALT